MSDYHRTTKECSLGQLRPELLRAIREYFHEHRLGDLETEPLACCETTSEKKSIGRLASFLGDDPDTIAYTGVLLTSQWLIWARSGDQSGTVVNAANLKEIQVKAFASKLSKDTGLEIVGYIGKSKGRVRGYLAMGPELAAQTFCEQVQQAISKVKPPVRRGFPRWLGG
jgi:hypothetical protein